MCAQVEFLLCPTKIRVLQCHVYNSASITVKIIPTFGTQLCLLKACKCENVMCGPRAAGVHLRRIPGYSKLKFNPLVATVVSYVPCVQSCSSQEPKWQSSCFHPIFFFKIISSIPTLITGQRRQKQPRRVGRLGRAASTPLRCPYHQSS